MPNGQSIRLNPYQPDPFRGLPWKVVTKNATAEADTGYLINEEGMILTFPENPINNTLMQYKLGPSIFECYLKTNDDSYIHGPNYYGTTINIKGRYAGGTYVYIDGDWYLFGDAVHIKTTSEIHALSSGVEYQPLSEKAVKSLFKGPGTGEEYSTYNSNTIRNTTVELAWEKKALPLDEKNIDDITDTGFYAGTPDTEHGTTPMSGKCTLTVIKYNSSYIMQNIVYNDSNASRVFYRFYNGTSWTQWDKGFYNSSDFNPYATTVDVADKTLLSEAAIRELFASSGTGTNYGLNAAAIHALINSTVATAIDDYDESQQQSVDPTAGFQVNIAEPLGVVVQVSQVEEKYGRVTVTETGLDFSKIVGSRTTDNTTQYQVHHFYIRFVTIIASRVSSDNGNVSNAVTVLAIEGIDSNGDVTYEDFPTDTVLVGSQNDTKSDFHENRINWGYATINTDGTLQKYYKTSKSSKLILQQQYENTENTFQLVFAHQTTVWEDA